MPDMPSHKPKVPRGNAAIVSGYRKAREGWVNREKRAVQRKADLERALADTIDEIATCQKEIAQSDAQIKALGGTVEDAA